MKLKHSLIGGVLILFVGYGIGFYTKPAKVVEKTKVEIVTKGKEKVVVKRDVTTVTKQDNDGKLVTTIIDKSIEASDKETMAEFKEVKTKVTTRKKENWHISMHLNVDPTDPKPKFIPGASIDRRFLGNVWLGAYASKDKTFGLKISISF